MTSGIELVVPPALAGTVPYAYAAVTDPGRMVFTAGACPLDADVGPSRSGTWPARRAR